MKLELMELDWHKRRRPNEKIKVTDVTLIDYEQKHNHFCKMHVVYEDGTERELLSRVIYNKWKEHWVVDGMHVAVIVRS